MRALKILLLVLLITANLYSVTLYTPNGKSFNTYDGNHDSYNSDFYNTWVNSNFGPGKLYPNSEALGSWENNMWEYNCHVFAWNNWQGAERWSSESDMWKLGKPSPTSLMWRSSPNVWYTDSDNPIGIVSYISSSSSQAAICTYYGNHSARIVGSGSRYISKWGSLGIVKHPPSEVPVDYGSVNAYYKINPAYRPIGSGDPVGRNYQTISNALIGISSGNLIAVLSGTQTLSENITIPSGVTLTIKSGATVNLNGYYLKTTGGTITNNGTVNPDDIRVEQSGVLKGYYPSISSAATNASSGQTVNVDPGTYNEGTITVPSGVLLTLDGNDVTVRFSSNSKLEVNGELSAAGEDFVGQSGGTSSWQGIFVNGKAYIYNCTIKNASYGVKTTSCSSPTTISYNEFRDCTNGIVCYSGGTPNLRSNDFYNIQNAAIALNSTPANAQYNDVFQSNQSSVLLTSITTSGDFNHNRIFSSGLHGIWIGGYSNIQIENCSIERCNNGACVNITSTATPSVTPNNTIERIGYWSIYNGNANHCVNALNNTWVNMLNYGCVDTDDKDLPDKGDDGKDLFALGTDYYANGKYEHALGTFKNLILDYSDSD